MTKYVALVRGINPVNPKMRNENLRTSLERLGYQNVMSVIASGNIIFETQIDTTISDIEKAIEDAFYNDLELKLTVIVRSDKQLKRLAQINPFEKYKHNTESYLIVTFLKNSLSAKIESFDTYSIMGIYDHDICSITNGTNTRRPNLLAWLEKNHGKEITTRTWKTVERILKKMN